MYPSIVTGVDTDPFASFCSFSAFQSSGLVGLPFSHETPALADQLAEEHHAALQQTDVFCTGCGDRTEGFHLAGQLVELCPDCAEQEALRVLASRRPA